MKYTVGHWLRRNAVALERTTWYARVEGTGLCLTLAGYSLFAPDQP
jgi:hypothetical protein